LNNQYDLEPKTAIGNCGFLFVGRKNANLAMMRITNDGEILPNCGTVPAQLPDLKISDLQIQTGTLIRGVPVRFKFDINNLGNASTTHNYKIKFWLSPNNLLTSGAYLAGTMNGLSVPAGQSLRQVAGSFTVANTDIFYNPTLIVEIDADNQVQESNEENNLHSLGVPFGIDIANNCALTTTITNFVCNDKGTATTSDDVVSFTLNPTGEAVGSIYYLAYLNRVYQKNFGKNRYLSR
jgi:hypothetical protein